ncbi:MAG TPA: helix-turn-helix domain-containing protein [Gemmataceae bacterium]|nr:helix-turn-helix domain-containing protein [Gemmataceae bacterium]
MSEEQPSDTTAKHPRRLAKTFRWQAFFQRCAEPLFVLDRRRRLLFVNAAWEALTGIAKEQAHLLVCRRPRPTSADDSPEAILAHALTPPREVLHGNTGCIRRQLPAHHPLAGVSGWWEIEFFPLLQEGPQGGYLILGRIRAVPAVEPVGEARPFEDLIPLRQRRIHRFPLESWASSLPAVRRLADQVRLASQTTTPVLLIGEAGTGKQTLARTIHYLSSHRDGAFAMLDCRHLPPTALAGFLFPEHMQGDPASSLAAIYLREPASLPRELQLQLSQRLARGSVLGWPRIFAGCRIPLLQAVRSGQLLEALAYALGVLVLEVPPLRERMADFPSLVERLLPRACAGRDVRVTSLSADAWTLFRGYSWPGNLRELYNVLRTACSRAQGEQLRAAELPAELRRAVQHDQMPARPADKSLPLEQLLEEAERRLIQLALQRARGNKAQAARLLGIPRPRLWRRMLKLGIVDPEKEADWSDDDAGPE